MSEQPVGTQDKGETDAPSPRVVNRLHTKSDVDSSNQAQHHTLGPKKDQATSGTHNHDGRNSVQLLSSITISGSKGGNAALASVIAALVSLGAKDIST